MEPVERVTVSPQVGIHGSVSGGPLRQVLLLPGSSLRRFAVPPGSLRENVIVEMDNLHDLRSGAVVEVGTSRIRMTFHCEPCGRIAGFGKPASFLHERGYLGAFNSPGLIAVGDSIRVTSQLMEPIPYEIPERIEWFLRRHRAPISCAEFLPQVGLSQSYARALPRILKKIDPELRPLVLFRSGNHAQDRQTRLPF